MIKKIFFNIKFLFLILAVIIIFFCMVPFVIQNFMPSVKIDKKIIDSLICLKNVAFEHGEYPVSAILLYNDSIIGTGYNTFRQMNDPLGHAEVNAIRDAFKKYNYLDFKTLNSNKLVLLTSYEPCMMCRGILMHYKITKILYLEPKSFRIHWYYQRNNIKYYWRLRKIIQNGV
jgi:tRNA(Arg) A34 adenosine deaminase TadA